MTGNVNIGALIASLGIDLDDFEKGIKEAKKQMDDAEKSMKKNMDSVEKRIERTGKKIQKFGEGLKKVGRNMTMYISTPLLGLGVAAGKAEMDFEAFLTKIISLVGVSRKQVNQWRGDIMSLAGEVAQSPQQLADAMYFITSAGLRGAEAMDVLKASAKASAVGMGEVKVIADLVTDAMNAFGSENLSASNTMDILTNAVRLGKVEAEDLVVSMGHVFPTAAKLGVSFNDVAAAIAAMTRTGTPAETAAVQIRQLLSQLIGPATEAETAFRTLSNAMENGSISARDLRETMVNEGLFAALKKFDDAIKEVGSYEMAKDIFGNVRALTGVFDIMGKNVEDNAMIFEDMAKSTGRANRAFEIVQETLKFKWQQALADGKVTLTEFGKELKKGIIPLLEDLSNMLKKVTKWFSNLSDEERKSMFIKIGLVAAIGPVLSILGNLTIVIGGAVIVFGKLRAILLQIPAAFRNLSAAVASNPIGAVAVVVSAAVAALISYKIATKEAAKEQGKLGQEIKNVNKEIGKQIYESLFPSKQEVKKSVDEITKIIGDLTPKDFEGFNEAFNEEKINTLKNALSDMSLGELKSVKLYFEHELPKAVRKSQQATGEMKKIWQSDVDFITKILSILNNEIGETEKIVEGIKKALNYSETDNFFKRLKGDVKAMFDAIDERSKVDLGEGFDPLAEKISFIQSKINTLLGPEHQFKVDSKEVQYLIDLLEQLGFFVNNLSKDLETDIAKAFFKVEESASAMKMLGEEVDVNAEKLKVVQDFIAKVLDGEYGDNTFEQFNKLQRIVNGLKLPLGEIDQMFQDLADQLDLNQRKFELFGDSFTLFEKVNADLSATQSTIENIMGSKKDLTEDQIRRLSELINKTRSLKDVQSELLRRMQQAEATIGATQQLFTGLAQSMGQVMVGAGKWEDILTVIGQFMIQIGEAIVATSKAWMVFKKSLIAAPAVSLAAGLGLIALGAALMSSSSFNSKDKNTGGYQAVPVFADGGLVYGPTIGQLGEYPGAKTNPEVVGKLSDLKNLINNESDNGRVEFEIHGDRLYGVLENYNKKINSFR